MNFAAFTIPLPPSTNNLFFNRPRKGRTKTTEYKAWLDEAAWTIRAQRAPEVFGDVRLDLIIERPNKASDLDNRVKAAQDAIQKAGVLKNDNQVVELYVRWGDVKGAQVTIMAVAKVAIVGHIDNLAAAKLVAERLNGAAA